MKIRMWGLLLLGASQGLIGWWMVKSGIHKKDNYLPAPSVSSYRLIVHNSMALGLYTALIYHYFILKNHTNFKTNITQYLSNIKSNNKFRRFAWILLLFVSLNMISGASVAGIQAGKVFNTWPSMNGSFIPSDYWKDMLGCRNLVENMATVQFNHRMFAYNTMAFAIFSFIRFRKFHNLSNFVK